MEQITLTDEPVPPPPQDRSPFADWSDADWDHCSRAFAAALGTGWLAKEIRDACYGGKRPPDRDLRILTKLFAKLLKHGNGEKQPRGELILEAVVRFRANVRGVAGYRDLIHRHIGCACGGKLESCSKSRHDEKTGYNHLMRNVGYWRKKSPAAEAAKVKARKLGPRKPAPSGPEFVNDNSGPRNS